MAQEIRSYAATIPVGTAKDSPVTVPMNFAPRIVDGLHIRIPPGPSGTVGFRIAASGTQVIPRNQGEWIVADNQVIDWTLTGFHDSGAWELIGYNTGTYPHIIYVQFLLELVGGPLASANLVPLAPLEMINTP